MKIEFNFVSGQSPVHVGLFELVKPQANSDHNIVNRLKLHASRLAVVFGVAVRNENDFLGCKWQLHGVVPTLFRFN